MPMLLVLLAWTRTQSKLDFQADGYHGSCQVGGKCGAPEKMELMLRILTFYDTTYLQSFLILLIISKDF